MTWSLRAAAHSELIIRKSRFLGCVQPVADRAAAQRLVADLRREHPRASHVCWALLAGGESAAVDDGEPSGTAGRPMLEVLRLQDLDGVLATIVRYFGGIKLGAGGLHRAYTDSIAQALKSADKVPIVRLRTLRCTVPHALEDRVRREIAAAGGSLQDVTRADEVTFVLAIVEEAAEALVARLQHATRGRIRWLPESRRTDGGKHGMDNVRSVY